MILHIQDSKKISFHLIRILGPSLFFREGISQIKKEGGKMNE